MKIGLLGGSFNPPHQGHLHISIQAKKHLKLNQIWWLPNKQNPLKKQQNSSFNKRLLQCQKLTKNYYPQILVKDYEQKISSNYSIDILKRLKQKYPRYQFFFIMGADNIAKFHLWHEWKQIIKLIPIIILDRDCHFNSARKSKAFLHCQKYHKKRCYLLKTKKYNISSTLLRN